MRVWDWKIKNEYDYGDENIYHGKYSKMLGNVFLLKGTVNDLNNINKEDSFVRIGSFYEKSGDFETSESWLDVAEWGKDEIVERTEWLGEVINEKFPNSCFKDEWISRSSMKFVEQKFLRV